MNTIDFTINGHRYTNDPTIAQSAGIPPEYQFIGYSAINALANYALDVVAAGGGSTDQAEAFAEAAEVSALVSLAAAQGVQIIGTSATAVTIDTGPKTFVTQPGKQWPVNVPIIAVNPANVAQYVYGTIGSYAGTSLTINVTSISGVVGDSVANWVISTSGLIGPRGLTASNTQFDVVPVAAFNIDHSLGNYFTKAINGNSTFTFSNTPPGGYSFSFRLTHTSGVIVLPASVRWSDNVVPVLTSGKAHIFVFVTEDGGATWRAAVNRNYPS